MGLVLDALFRLADLMRGDFRLRRRPPRPALELPARARMSAPSWVRATRVSSPSSTWTRAEVRSTLSTGTRRACSGWLSRPYPTAGRLPGRSRASFTGTIRAALYRLAVTSLRGPIVEAALRKLKTGAEVQPGS